MKFKLLLPLAVALFASNFVSAQESSTSDAFIDLQRIRDNFEVKNGILSRLFNLLQGTWATTEAPEAEEKRELPSIVAPFRRLNIFGLQLPLVKQPLNPDGTFCSSCPDEGLPEVLSVTVRPEDANTPSFFVVPPPGSLRSERLTAVQPTHHYQELKFDDLKREAAENQINRRDSVVDW